MLVSHRYEFIFTKTVKTAGTSVELFLEPFCAVDGHKVKRMTDAVESPAGIIGARGAPARVEGARWYNHMPAALIKAQLGDALWSAYHKFTIVRNPYDKMVSWFHFRQLPRKESDGLAFAEIKARFRRFVLAGIPPPMIDRDKYTIDGSVCVDRFLRYESLAADLQGLAAGLGLDVAGRELPRAKGRFRPQGFDVRDYYDNDSAAAVAEAFDFELRTFDYRL